MRAHSRGNRSPLEAGCMEARSSNEKLSALVACPLCRRRRCYGRKADIRRADGPCGSIENDPKRSIPLLSLSAAVLEWRSKIDYLQL